MPLCNDTCRSQMSSKYDKNKKLAQLSVSLMFSPHFDVFCDLLLYWDPQQHHICLFIWQKLKILWWHHPCICQQYSTTIFPKVRWILLNNPNTDPKKQGNYWTIFNEPEVNNCLSIIAQVLLNYVVKCFLWVKPFWYNGFDRIEMSSQFPLKFNS